MKKIILFTVMLLGSCDLSYAQQSTKPEETEVWEPVPAKVTPVKFIKSDPPADAIILFDGKNLDEWVSNADRNKPADWKVDKGVLIVNKAAGNIETKRLFSSYQLHIEWCIPANITGSGQARGNSGLFLASLGKGDPGYELQIVDSYDNKTYVNGMAGSIYKQLIPLVNPARKPGEWQTFDVAWKAPKFDANGKVINPACVTVWFNGILVQNNVELLGPTRYIGKASYDAVHGPAPIKLQAHGDKSEPISFRNIWVRQVE